MGCLWVLETAKAEMLEKLHLSHSGNNKTLALARSLYFWTGIVKDIKKLVWSYPECECYRAQCSYRHSHALLVKILRMSYNAPTIKFSRF